MNWVRLLFWQKRVLFFGKVKAWKNFCILVVSIYSTTAIIYNTIHLMSGKEDKIETTWVIVKALPGLVFEVQLPEDFWWGIVNGYLSGKMRKNFIKLIAWDTVKIELSPYDLTKGRITFRGKEEKPAQ